MARHVTTKNGEEAGIGRVDQTMPERTGRIHKGPENRIGTLFAAYGQSVMGDKV
jgi:hypothetical protein